jgi:predicted dehydrogenase
VSKKTSERVRVGIVGGGRIADLNKIGWLEHDCADIVAVCDVNDARRQARAPEWQCKAYAELDDIFADSARTCPADHR